jgi:hypothetical protein
MTALASAPIWRTGSALTCRDCGAGRMVSQPPQ